MSFPVFIFLLAFVFIALSVFRVWAKHILNVRISGKFVAVTIYDSIDFIFDFLIWVLIFAAIFGDFR